MSVSGKIKVYIITYRMNSLRVEGASRAPGGVGKVDPAISLDCPKYFMAFLKDELFRFFKT